MSHGWQITCGKCNKASAASRWMQSAKVLMRVCDFQCPECGVSINRVLKDVKIIRTPQGEPMFAHGRVVIEEVA